MRDTSCAVQKIALADDAHGGKPHAFGQNSLSRPDTWGDEKR
jgi:hypothetical protein